MFESEDYTDIAEWNNEEFSELILSSVVEADLEMPDPEDQSTEAQRRRRLIKYIKAMIAVIRALTPP